MKAIIVPIVAIVAIVVLARTAMLQGIDTYIYTGAMVTIAGLGGYRLKVYREHKKNRCSD